MRAAKAGRAFFILSCAWTVTGVAARLPQMGWIAPVGAAMAQDTGHTDGGHTGGPGSSGGHDEGDTGHTGGPGGHGQGQVEAAVDEVGGHGSPVPPKPPGSFRDPDYFRVELGFSAPRATNAYWLPPGAGDPEVDYGLDLKRVAYGSLAVGHYWGGGLRSEIALTGFAPSAFSTTAISTQPPTPGTTHATMTGTTSSYLVMANGYYTPYIKALGRVQPYVSAGVGVSANTMGTWTRTNLTKPDPTRSFEGTTTVALAGAIGAGLEVYLGEVSGKPTSLDLGYRYYSLGKVEGSTTPTGGSGSVPRKALNFNKTEQVVSVSLRVWF